MRVSRLWVLPGVACAAFMLSCESSPDSVAGLDDIPPVRFAPAPCAPDDQRGRCRGETGATESAKVVLGGKYSTPTGEQDIIFKQTGRAVEAKTADGTTIMYQLDITLPFSFTQGECDWSGVANAAAAETFWKGFLFDTDTQQKDQARVFFIRVNMKALDEPNREHRTEARWWVEDEDIDDDPQLDRVMYLVKAGTPGDLLGSPHAIGSFDDGKKELTITGGAVRLTKSNCGDVTGLTAGCGPQAETVEVACRNPLTGDDAQVFTATVTP